jgi:hypothetical protein
VAAEGVDEGEDVGAATLGDLAEVGAAGGGGESLLGLGDIVVGLIKGDARTRSLQVRAAHTRSRRGGG